MADAPIILRPELCAACARGASHLCFEAAYTIGRGPCLDRQRHWDAGFAAATALERLRADGRPAS